MEKLKVMNSRTGLRLLKAAPTARPEKPISVIGVSVIIGEIRKRVNLVVVHCNFVLTDNPLVAPLLPQTPGHLVGSVVLGNLLAHDEHLGGEHILQTHSKQNHQDLEIQSNPSKNIFSLDLVVPGQLLIKGHIQRVPHSEGLHHGRTGR